MESINIYGSEVFNKKNALALLLYLTEAYRNEGNTEPFLFYDKNLDYWFIYLKPQSDIIQLETWFIQYSEDSGFEYSFLQDLVNVLGVNIKHWKTLY